jgi:MFS family permease
MSDGGPKPYLLPVFLGSAPFVFINFGLPTYARALDANALAIGGMYTAFMFTMLLVRPIVGWALDRYGRKWFFAVAFLFYAGAMLFFSGANTLVDFYVARFLQGIGASFMWVSARTMVADLSTEADRGSEMGRMQALSVRGSMVGAFYGFTLLGLFATPRAWQLAFLGYAAAAIFGFVASIVRVEETRQVHEHVGLSRLEFRPAFTKLLVIVFLSGFASALIEPIYLIFLQDKFDLPMTVLAMAFFPAGIVFAILPRYAGAWSDRIGRAPVIVVGIIIAAFVSGGLPWLPHIFWVAVMYTLSAVGWAMANPAQDALLGSMTDETNRGRMFGYKEAAASVGAALGPLAGGAIYDYWRPEYAFLTNGAVLIATAGLFWVWFGARRTE